MYSQIINGSLKAFHFIYCLIFNINYWTFLKHLKITLTKMSTFGADELLPSLPLPSLEATLDKYLESTRPFVNESEYKITEKVVEDFKNGIGRELHQLLELKAKRDRNWVKIFLILIYYLSIF